MITMYLGRKPLNRKRFYSSKPIGRLVSTSNTIKTLALPIHTLVVESPWCKNYNWLRRLKDRAHEVDLNASSITCNKPQDVAYLTATYITSSNINKMSIDKIEESGCTQAWAAGLATIKQLSIA